MGDSSSSSSSDCGKRETECAETGWLVGCLEGEEETTLPGLILVG